MTGKSLTELPQTNELKKEDLILISRNHDTGNAALSRSVKAETIVDLIGQQYVRVVNDEDVKGVKDFKDGIKIGGEYKVSQQDGTLKIDHSGLTYVQAEDGKVFIGSNTPLGDPLVKAYAPVPTSVSQEVATTRWVNKNYAAIDHKHGYSDLSGANGFAIIDNMAGEYNADEGKYIDGIKVNPDSTLSIHQSSFKEVNVVTLDTIIDTLYPVGSIYIGVQDICPISYIKGTWQNISAGKCLQTAGGKYKAGSYIEQGLPGITANASITGTTSSAGSHSHSYGIGVGDCGCGKNGGNLPRSTHVRSIGTYGATSQSGNHTHKFSASVNLNMNKNIYGKTEEVQPPAFAVNVWRRIA